MRPLGEFRTGQGVFETASLGEFKPVTEAQVDEVRNRLEMR